MRVVRVDDLMSGDDLHIQNAPGLSGGAAITLCGFVDVYHDYEEGVPTCRECLAILRYCKKLRITPA